MRKATPFAGPRRFTDLMTGLPEISTNLLTERLKSLEQHGLIQRHVLPPPAASMVYALTPLGQALEAALLELGKWGSQLMPPMTDDAPLLHLGSYALTPMTFFRSDAAQGINETYTLHIDGETLQFHIADGAISVRQGESRAADVTLHAPMRVYMGLLAGMIDPEAAVAGGMIQVEGKMDALRRFLQLCGLPTTLAGNAVETVS